MKNPYFWTTVVLIGYISAERCILTEVVMFTAIVQMIAFLAGIISGYFKNAKHGVGDTSLADSERFDAREALSNEGKFDTGLVAESEEIDSTDRR